MNTVFNDSYQSITVCSLGDYQGEFKQFCSWMMKHRPDIAKCKRLVDNPMVQIYEIIATHDAIAALPDTLRQRSIVKDAPDFASVSDMSVANSLAA